MVHNAAMATLAATDLRPRRLVIEHLSLTIEGRTLEDVALGGWVYGPELGTAPVILIVGGITASPFPFGDGQAEGEDPRAPWWPALCAPDLIDPAKHTVLCPSWPGNGSTWKGFDDPGAMDSISVAGLADLVAAWLDGCGCNIPVTWVGASLGGMVGVVFAARHAERCAKLITISAGLRPDGWGTATRHLQRELVRDGLRNGDVATGMSRARQLGMLTYRGRDELDTRFGKLLPGLDRPPVAEYLDHHGRRFAERFPVKTFLMLSEAIDRGSMADAQAVRDAFEKVSAETVVVGVPGDMLFPWALQVELHRALQAAGADSSLWKLDSLYGHDAFLADQDRLAELLRGAHAFGGELRQGGAAAVRGRRGRAGARDPHRPGRLRHRRPGTAGDDRSAERRRGRALRREVPRVADCGQGPEEESWPALGWDSPDRSAARARQRSGSRCRRGSRGRHGGRGDAASRRWPPASRW